MKEWQIVFDALLPGLVERLSGITGQMKEGAYLLRELAPKLERDSGEKWLAVGDALADRTVTSEEADAMNAAMHDAERLYGAL